MLGGGKNREWLRPLDQHGNRQSDDPRLDTMVGCHTGEYVHLNIINPEPGFVYVWERNTGRDKLRARQKGGRILGAQDPEISAMNALMDEGGQSPIDSTHVFGDVILVKYPEHRVREVREREQAIAQARMRSGHQEYAERAAAIEQQLSRGLPSRFAKSEHGLEFKDAQDHTVDHWVPEDGIIRER